MPFNPKLTDLVVDCGGDTLLRYGTLTRRLAPPTRGGEALIETVTRASPGGSITPQGTFLPVQAGTPKLTWIKDANGIYQPRLLLEAAATNKLTFPEDLSNAAWTKGFTTVPSINNTSPRSDATASFVREDSSAGNHYVLQNFTLAASADTVGASLYLRSSGRNRCRVQMDDQAGTNGFLAELDLTAGTVGAPVVFGTGVGTFAQLTPALANTWYKLELYGKIGTGTATRLLIYLEDGSGNPSYTGGGTLGLYVWGCVATDNTLAGMYWGTGASRNADACTLPYPYKPQAGWLYIKFIESGGAFGVNFGSLVAVAPDLNPGIGILKQNGVNRYYAFHHNGSTEVDSLLGAGPALGDTVELLLILSSTGAIELRQSLNGAADTTGGVSGTNALAATWANQVLGLNGGTNKAAAAVARLLVGLNSLPSSIPDVRTVLAGLPAA